MKIIEFNIDKIKRNIKKNWKITIAILLLFVILGTLGVLIDSKRNTRNSKTATAQQVPLLSISDIDKDGGYYYKAFCRVKNKANEIGTYIIYFEQIPMSINSRDRLKETKNLYMQYCTDEYISLLDSFRANPAAIDDKYDLTVEFYKNKVNELEDKIESYEKKTKDIEKSRIRKADKLTKIKNYDDLKAVAINDKIVCQKIEKNLMTSNKITIDNNSKIMNDVLKNNILQLNNIINELNSAMDDIAKDEQYEIVYNDELMRNKLNATGLLDNLDYDKVKSTSIESAVAYAKSIEGIDTVKERSIAIMIFCSIVGALVAIMVGAFYEKN